MNELYLLHLAVILWGVSPEGLLGNAGEARAHHGERPREAHPRRPEARPVDATDRLEDLSRRGPAGARPLVRPGERGEGPAHAGRDFGSRATPPCVRSG